MAVAGCAYDVFLSFRGKDTRKTFTDHLYVALVQAGCHTFRDDDEIVRGEDIESEPQKAIEQSRISIVVFSKTYACSRLCLEELVKILRHKKTSLHEVLPIFYDVDPSDVRKQTGSFAEAFTRHEMRLGTETNETNEEWMKKLEHWRAALRDVSNLAGMVLQNEFDGLVALDLQYSNLKRVWEGTKFCRTLKILDLSHSQELTKTPNLSGVPNLEELILEDCVNLVKIHESIEKLEGLILLNLEDCKNLKNLPCNICMLKSLKTLIISGCSNLDWWQIEGQKIGSLKVLHTYGVRVKQSASEVVKSWQGIIRLHTSKPRKSPNICFFQLPRSLVKLSLAGSNLFNDDFLLDFSNMPLLEYLDLSANNICSLPESVRDLTGLRKLLVDSCKRLTSLTGVSNIGLKQLSVKDCASLQKVSYLSTLSGPLTIFCRDCENLVEIEGHFKLESMSAVDVENLKAWGFSNIEAVVPWYNMSASELVKWLSLHKLFKGGVYSYFLPGDEIPSVFSIKARGSSLSFLVPSRAHYKIQGFVICCIYTTWTNVVSVKDFLAPLTTTIDNKTKHVKCAHCPVSIGIPKANENMIWTSHWNSRDLLDGGDEVVVSVHSMEFYAGLTRETGRCTFEVKEVGVIFLYERQGEIATHETFACKDMVLGDLSPQEMLYSVGGRSVVRHKRHSSGGPLQIASYTLTRGM